MASNSAMDESAPSTSRGSGDVAVKVEEEPIGTVTVTYFDLVPPIPDAERLAAEVKVEPEDGAATTDQQPIEIKEEIKDEPGTSGGWKHLKKGKAQKKAVQKENTKRSSGGKRNGRSYQCHSCKHRCISQLSLEDHIRTHVDERPFRCNICGKSFKLKGNLVSHFKTHSDEKPFGCSHCAMQFKRKQTLQCHMRTHTELLFSCTICRQNFATPNALGKHEMAGKCHGFECHLCGKSFPHKHHLKEHMRIHTGDKPHQCERCRKCFAQYSTLKQHLATHSDEKPFSCDFCSKKFKCKENLKRHSNMHPDQFPFECSNHHCDRRFAGKDKKTAHEKRCKKAEPKHICAICGKSFRAKKNLRRHMLVHSTEKNFKCFCGKGFKHEYSLARHSKQHKICK